MEESVVVTFPFQIYGNHATELSTFGHVISERHWKSTFDFTEIINNFGLKRGIVKIYCEIYFSLFLWNYIYNFKIFISRILLIFYIFVTYCVSFLSSSLLLIEQQLPEVFYKKGALTNFAKFTGKHPCQSHFFNKRTLAQVFSCEFCKIFKNIFFTEHLWWLLLLIFRNFSFLKTKPCAKSMQIWSFFWSVFCIFQNSDQKKLRIWTLFNQWGLFWSLLRNIYFLKKNQIFCY